MAGSCGGYFKTGRSLALPAGTPNNGLLVALCNAMDTPVTTFGEAVLRRRADRAQGLKTQSPRTIEKAGDSSMCALKRSRSSLGGRGAAVARGPGGLQRTDRRGRRASHGTGSSGGNGSGSGAGGGGVDHRTRSDRRPPRCPITTTGTPPAESAGTLVMRRLTYAEYDHMLADLLGDTTAPAEGGQRLVARRAERRRATWRPTSVADLQVDLYNQTADARGRHGVQGAGRRQDGRQAVSASHAGRRRRRPRPRPRAPRSSSRPSA